MPRITCLTTLVIGKMQIKPTLKFHLKPIRLAKIKTSSDSTCWRGYGARRTLLLCLWECKLVCLPDFFVCLPDFSFLTGRGRGSCHSVHIEVREQLLGVSFLYPPCSSQTELRLTGLAGSAFSHRQATKKCNKADATPKTWERNKSELGKGE